jgi:hypothetical protein
MVSAVASAKAAVFAAIDLIKKESLPASHTLAITMETTYCIYLTVSSLEMALSAQDSTATWQDCRARLTPKWASLDWSAVDGEHQREHDAKFSRLERRYISKGDELEQTHLDLKQSQLALKKSQDALKLAQTDLEDSQAALAEANKEAVELARVRIERTIFKNQWMALQNKRNPGSASEPRLSPDRRAPPSKRNITPIDSGSKGRRPQEPRGSTRRSR